MKVTLHGGQKGTAKHNDHKFKSNHIDAKKTRFNKSLFTTKNVKNNVEAEQEIFTKLYSDALAKQNAKHVKNRQLNRVRTIEDWIKAPRYKAREEIFQIGDIDTHATAKDLYDCMIEFSNWKVKTFGKRMRTISLTFHVDESTPHAHERDTWFYVDSDGVKYPGMAKALEQLGVPLPDATKPIDKKNNRMMTYTAMCREKWQDICFAHGLDIDKTPDKTRELGNLPPDVYKAYKQALAEVEALKSDLTQREALLQAKQAELQAKQRDLEKWEHELQRREQNVGLAEKTKEMLDKSAKTTQRSNVSLSDFGMY